MSRSHSPAGVMRRFARDRRREQIARPDQYGFVRGQPGQKLVCSAPGSQFVGGSEALAVLLHLIGAEQLRSQRRLFVSVRTMRVGPAKTRPQLEQYSGDSRAACLQLRVLRQMNPRPTLHWPLVTNKRRCRRARPYSGPPTLPHIHSPLDHPKQALAARGSLPSGRMSRSRRHRQQPANAPRSVPWSSGPCFWRESAARSAAASAAHRDAIASSWAYSVRRATEPLYPFDLDRQCVDVRRGTGRRVWPAQCSSLAVHELVQLAQRFTARDRKAGFLCP